MADVLPEAADDLDALAPETALATTVVIPVWGESYVSYLAGAVDSILSQDRRARVLLVDNAAGLAPVEREDVEVLRCPRRVSLGYARNAGLEAVSTPYVLFWDADDVMLPGTLARLEATLDRNSGAIAAVAGIVEAPGVPHPWPRPLSARLARRPRLLALAQAVTHMFPTTGAALMRTEVVREAGGFGDFGGPEDWVLGAAIAFRGRVEFDPHPGRLYRQHDASLRGLGIGFAVRIKAAAAVRRRLRTGPGVPRVVRAAAPALAPLQLLVIFVVGPVARAAAGLRGAVR